MSLTGQGRKKVTPRNVKVPGISENLTRCPTPANDNSSPNLHERERARLLPRPTTPYNRAMPSEPFEPTQWSLVLAAHISPRSRPRCVGPLCHAYWYPIYAFIRRRGYSADAAEDLTQDFFARVLEEGFLAQVDREKARFAPSCWRLASIPWPTDAITTGPRSAGDRIALSRSIDGCRGRYLLESWHHLTPEALYERHWALTLLQQVFEQLRLEFEQSGLREQFEALRSTLADPRSVPYTQIADQLNTTEGAVQVAAHRLRRRYRSALRAGSPPRSMIPPGSMTRFAICSPR